MSDIPKLKILIVDDHQMFIDGIKALLRNEDQFSIEAEALSGKQALAVLESTQIDIVITDISMPEMDGVELTKTIKKLYPDTKVLVLSMYNDKDVISDIVFAEAEGYILKNTGKKELVEALTTIANNETHYGQEIVSIMMSKIKADKKKETDSIELSKREVEILQLICEEYSSEDIAEKLFISRRTVDTHRKNIIAKTKAKTIVGLIKFAIQNNIYKISI